MITPQRLPPLVGAVGVGACEREGPLYAFATNSRTRRRPAISRTPSSARRSRLLTASPRPSSSPRSLFGGWMTTRRPLIAGNWKMNGLKASERELAGIVAGAAGLRQKIDLMVCPPATLIMRFVEAAGGAVAIGGQDCHAEPSGAFTGDISAEMLADLGASAVIVGHS